MFVVDLISDALTSSTQSNNTKTPAIMEIDESRDIFPRC